jgi:2-methylcitrate dehydratase
MDDVVEQLAGLVRAVERQPLSSEVVHEIKRRILDTIGIAFGGHAEAPTRLAREFAGTTALAERPFATVWGSATKTTPELAAFANGTAMHSQDYMDAYLSPSGEACHPADIIPGVLALGEHLDCSPSDVIQALVVGYEVAVRLCDAAQIRSRGWDHVTYIALATACSCASLLDLDDGALRAALSLAVIPNVALRQTRNGEISMWKACAPANAVQNGIRAARLASHGLMGPSEPFTGDNGFERRVSGPLDRDALCWSPGEPLALFRTHIKYRATQYNAQAGVEAAMVIHGRLATPVERDPIERIRIRMSEVCHQFTADSANKWSPRTRETADHSLPYLVIVALHEGRLDERDFLPSAFRDPARLADVAKVRVEIDDDMTAAYPELLSVEVELVQRSGATEIERVDHPLGHCSRPMSDAQVEDKYRRLVAGRLDEEAIDRIARTVRHLEELDGIGELLPLLARSG